MADIGALVERFKNNKLAIPALAVGAIVGGYVLIKNGGLSGGGGSFGASQEDYVNDALAQAEQIASQGGGSGGGSAGDSVAAEQQGFMQSVLDYLNDFAGQVQGVINSQADQTQGAINAIAGQNESAINSLYDELNKQAQAFSGYAQPDFSSLYAAMQAIPQQAYQEVAPQLQSLQAVNSSKISNAVNQIRSASQTTQGGKISGSRGLGINLGSLIRLPTLGGSSGKGGTNPVKSPPKPIVRPGTVNPTRPQIKPVKPRIQSGGRQILPTLMSYTGGKPSSKPKASPVKPRGASGSVLRK